MTDDIDTLKLACAQFVRYQRELCDLLDEDTEGDSIALHTRIVYGIKAMKERLDPPPQAPIAQLTINQAGEIAGTLMYAPGLPPGDHDLYCEPEALAPYLREQGRSAADCRAHNPEVAGSNPAPASIAEGQPGCAK